jgi:DNA-binding NtrC family response regulator
LIELVVLVFEQEAGRRRELERALTKEGYQLRFVTGGSALLSEVNANPPHLVILDLDLPQNEGMALVKAVRDIRPGVPIVCETATPTVESAVEAMRRGAYNYISKFSPVRTLTDMISHALERERMEVDTHLR